MANSNQQAQQGGVGILGLLFVLFVGLKLTGVIGWSWWWVTAPIWGPAVAVLVFAIIALIFAILAALFNLRKRR